MHRLPGLLLIGLCVVGLTAGGCDRGQETPTEPSPEVPSEPDGSDNDVNLPGDADAPEDADGAAPAEPASPAPSTTSTPTASAQPGSGTTTAVGTAISPPKPAQLIAQQPEARINLRSEPSTSASTKGYGLVGDPIQLLRSTEAADGYQWYYVKFEQSGAEGWIRSDFVNVAGRAQALPSDVNPDNTCEGLMEVLAFEAYYSGNRFQMIRFTNLESKSTFDSPLRQATPNSQGQPVYVGQVSPPTGGSYAVQLTDLSGGSPGSGTQVSVNYSDFLSGTGSCN